MASIKISELNNLQVITSDDFIPIDDSGSMTTYRISVSTLSGFIAASGSVMSSSFATSASYARSASYSVSSSNSFTSSYAIVASDAYWSLIAFNANVATSASNALTASYALTTPVTASHATTASNTITASNAISSSYAISASYSYSGSYALSSSNAVTASNAITAAFAYSTTPTALVYPPLISGLRIIPSWKTQGLVQDYVDIPFQQLVVRADALVLTDAATGTNSKVLQYQTVLIDRNLPVGTATANTGSLDAGVFAINQWYNIWIIYNSSLNRTSGMICQSPVSGALYNSSPVLPSGYDYWVRVGSIKDSSGTFWREWHEYGTGRKWFYRTAMPSGYGISGGGLTLSHLLGDVPRNTSIRLKLKQISGPSATGFAIGDELRAEDFIADIDQYEVDMSAFGTAATADTLKVWRTVAAHGIKSSRSTDGAALSWGNAAASAPYFDLLISAEI